MKQFLKKQTLSIKLHKGILKTDACQWNMDNQSTSEKILMQQSVGEDRYYPSRNQETTGHFIMRRKWLELVWQ